MSEIVFPEEFRSSLSGLCESLENQEPVDDVLGWFGLLLDKGLMRVFEPQDRRFVTSGVERASRIVGALLLQREKNRIYYSPNPAIFARYIMGSINNSKFAHDNLITQRLERNPVRDSMLEYGDYTSSPPPSISESCLDTLVALELARKRAPGPLMAHKLG